MHKFSFLLLHFVLALAVCICISCGPGERFHYIIPDGYEGFLTVEYNCPNGDALAITSGISQICFRQNGTACLAASGATVHPSGMTWLPSATLYIGQVIKTQLNDSNVANITGYTLLDIGQFMQRTDYENGIAKTREFTILWVGDITQYRVMEAANLYQEKLALHLEQNAGIQINPSR